MSDGVIIGDELKENDKPAKLLVTLNGEQIEIDYQDESKSVLDALIDEGINAPYSCMDGACMACMAKVVEGTVSQLDYGVLSEDNVAERECLTCQARPKSQKVVIDYDEL